MHPEVIQVLAGCLGRKIERSHVSHRSAVPFPSYLRPDVLKGEMPFLPQGVDEGPGNGHPCELPGKFRRHCPRCPGLTPHEVEIAVNPIHTESCRAGSRIGRFIHDRRELPFPRICPVIGSHAFAQHLRRSRVHAYPVDDVFRMQNSVNVFHVRFHQCVPFTG